MEKKIQTVSGITTICLMEIRLLIVACGMLSHSSSMAVQSCWILAGTGTRCCTRRSKHPKHAQWVTCLVSMQDSFQELCTDPHDMGPCIIMLKHEVMAVDEWHYNGPQDLVKVSLCCILYTTTSPRDGLRYRMPSTS